MGMDEWKTIKLSLHTYIKSLSIYMYVCAFNYLPRRRRDTTNIMPVPAPFASEIDAGRVDHEGARGRGIGSGAVKTEDQAFPRSDGEGEETGSFGVQQGGGEGTCCFWCVLL